MYAAAQQIRITPAYAGKSRTMTEREILTRDHPRIRGEKGLIRFIYAVHHGSPPHTRGKDNNIIRMLSKPGITPAYAGKRPIKIRRCRPWWDHPRIRGEKMELERLHYPKQGSPPHTRGKGVSGGLSSLAAGITPAYAGKSPTMRTGSSAEWDHPRIRGEKRSPLI